MKTSVIRVGNSKGIILSKTILEKYQIKDEVNIILEQDSLRIEPISKPRANWDALFKENKADHGKEEIMTDVFEDETFLEWD
jgi:antitoxin MazE